MTDTTLQLTQAPIAQKGMLIRRPVAEVFQAFADPAVTTRFWFTRSSGKVTQGAKLRWDWEMFGATAYVWVKAVEENKRILFDWGTEEQRSTVELKFVPHKDDTTYVQVVLSNWSGTGDQIVAQALDNISGFALVLAAAKALLEHGVVLTVVLDHFVPGLKV